jgi:hypothetical protein
MITKNSYSHGATQIPIPKQDFVIIEIEGELTAYQKVGNFYIFENPNKRVVNVWSYDGTKEGIEVRSIISMQKKLKDTTIELDTKMKKLATLSNDIERLGREKDKLVLDIDIAKEDFSGLDKKYKKALDNMENLLNIFEESLIKHRELLKKDSKEYEQKHTYIAERYADIDGKLSSLEAFSERKLLEVQRQSEFIEKRYEALEDAINGAVSKAKSKLADSEKKIVDVTKMSLESINNSFTQHRDALGKPLKEIVLIDQRTNRRMKICTVNGNLLVEEV